MRILLDESLPRALRTRLAHHRVVTVVDAGWSGLRNGVLLARAAEQFDVLVTADQNLQFQQNLSTTPIAVVVLCAPDNRIQTIDGLVPPLLEALTMIPPRTLVRIA